jgi:hypothetical protein
VPPFILDVDFVTEDLNDDGTADVIGLASFFDVWSDLQGDPEDPAGAVYLPLVDHPTRAGRTIRFDDDALQSSVVAGGPLPVPVPLGSGLGGGGGGVLEIPTLGSWGMSLLLLLLALGGWWSLRRTATAA